MHIPFIRFALSLSLTRSLSLLLSLALVDSEGSHTLVYERIERERATLTRSEHSHSRLVACASLPSCELSRVLCTRDRLCSHPDDSCTRSTQHALSLASELVCWRLGHEEQHYSQTHEVAVVLVCVEQFVGCRVALDRLVQLALVVASEQHGARAVPTAAAPPREPVERVSSLARCVWFEWSSSVCVCIDRRE